jgi:hypothetical protein
MTSAVKIIGIEANFAFRFRKSWFGGAACSVAIALVPNGHTAADRRARKPDPAALWAAAVRQSALAMISA